MRIEKTSDLVSALHNIRKNNDMTQEDLVSKMCIQKSNISRLEHSVHSPTLKMLKRYSDALGVELEFSIIRESL